MFDILDNDKGWDVSLVMDYDEQSEETATLMDQMKNIGYSSNNSTKNLGTVYITLVFYFMQVIFTLFLAVFYKITGKGAKLLQKMINSLFFTELLVMSIEGFMEFYICGYL
jgi:hypothetical protein